VEEGKRDYVLMPFSGDIAYSEMVAAMLPLLKFQTKALTLFHVIEMPISTPLDTDDMKDLVAAAELKIKPLSDWLSKQGYRVQTKVAVARHVKDAIIEEASDPRYSMLFMLKRRKRRKRFSKSVTEEIIGHVQLPVVTILV
jgi:nucleotide-binding universal stress UspA family protein